MEMMMVFTFNIKKYRKKKRLSQMKLAELLDTSTSYIGEIEINSRVPSMDMVERIAKALNVEPFRLFVDNSSWNDGELSGADDYLECLTTIERQDLAKRLLSRISNEIEQVLHPENRE
ncbi:MAG: helix-turn-helix domain-containing protein [Treponema sp.]|jgi:transcriptional regulator with XRE-family HTH domain|nr:helix-turn-helix domain-containing protein [Treponema sp.]